MDTDTVHQIFNVLRMRDGEKIILLDNTGKEYLSEITIDKRHISYKILEEKENAFEADISVTLYQSLLKSQDRFEWAAQKGTELGVATIIPLITERCQVSELKKKSRVEKIMKEASEQCERGIIPELKDEIDFENMLQEFSQQTDTTHLFFCENRRDQILELPELNTEVNVIIGPEGGFSDEELEKINTFCSENENAYVLSLGKRILRSETASIAALSNILTYF